MNFNSFLSNLKHDPIKPLLDSGYKPIVTFAKRDLLNEKFNIEDLWQLPEVEKITRKQTSSGYWIYPGKKENAGNKEDYSQLETYRNPGILVEEFGMNKKHPSIQKAAEYIFKCVSNEGDIRGIYGSQYSPNYTAGFLELLIKAGYENDKRVDKIFNWLLSVRQDDGGWAIPFRTHKTGISIIGMGDKTLAPDKSKPFSHLVTGVVLRAFAAHPKYRNLPEAKDAGQLLAGNLFKRDNYPDRSTVDFWTGFSFPFWYTDLLSALDSLSLLGFSASDPQIAKGLEWFIQKQSKDGLWNLRILKGKNKDVIKLYLALAICRMFKRFTLD